MIGNILDNTTELYMIKYTFGEIFSSGRATLYKKPSDQTVSGLGCNGFNLYSTHFSCTDFGSQKPDFSETRLIHHYT